MSAWPVLVLRAPIVLEREATMIQRSILLLLGSACVATSAAAQQPKKPDVRAIAHRLTGLGLGTMPGYRAPVVAIDQTDQRDDVPGC